MTAAEKFCLENTRLSRRGQTNLRHSNCHGSSVAQVKMGQLNRQKPGMWRCLYDDGQLPVVKKL